MRDFEKNFCTDEMVIRLHIPGLESEKATMEYTQQGVVNISHLKVDQLEYLQWLIGETIVELRKRQMY